MDWVTEYTRFKELNDEVIKEFAKSELRRADKTLAVEMITELSARMAIIELETFSSIKRDIERRKAPPAQEPEEQQEVLTPEQRKILIHDFMEKLRIKKNESINLRNK